MLSADHDIPSSDSTSHRVRGIDSAYMKRAALYARVTTHQQQQQQQQMIASQVLELRSKSLSGSLLVKEYIDVVRSCRR